MFKTLYLQMHVCRKLSNGFENAPQVAGDFQTVLKPSCKLQGTVKRF